MKYLVVQIRTINTRWRNLIQGTKYRTQAQSSWSQRRMKSWDSLSPVISGFLNSHEWKPVWILQQRRTRRVLTVLILYHMWYFYALCFQCPDWDGYYFYFFLRLTLSLSLIFYWPSIILISNECAICYRDQVVPGTDLEKKCEES